MTDAGDRPQGTTLDRSTCLVLLSTQAVGRLVFGGPDARVVPLNYVVEDERVIVRTEAGAHAASAVGTTVTFEVDAIDTVHRVGWSVVVRGHLADVTERLEGDETWNERLDPWAPGRKDRWLELTIDVVEGRSVAGVDRRPPLDGRAYL